jgi:tetratricopeptide (TPR) repeat protein
LGEQATAAYERALELNPDEPSIYSEYARWLLSTGGWQELEFQGKCPQRVCELVQRGLEKFPQDADLQELVAFFQDTMRMHQTDVAYATQDARLTQQTQDTPIALPTRTPRPTNTTRIASPTVTAAPSSKLPEEVAQAASTATLLPTTASLSDDSTGAGAAPEGGGGPCPAGMLPLVVVGMVAGVVFLSNAAKPAQKKG